MKTIVRTCSLLLVFIISSCGTKPDPAKGLNNQRFIYQILGTINSDTIKLGIIKEDMSSEFDNTDYHNNVIIRHGDRIVFSNTSGSHYDLSSVHPIKFIKGYLVLIRELNPIGNDWYNVIIIDELEKSKQPRKIIADILDDIDNDGIIEAGGYRLIDAYCVDCDSAYYNPIELFELKMDMVLDSVLIKEISFKDYGCFLGFEPLGTVVPILMSSLDEE